MAHSPTLRRLASGALSGALAATVLTVVTAPAASAAEAPTTHVRITKFHNVKMPTRLRPGVHRFAVSSTRQAGFQIIRPHAGYTKREITHDVRVGFEGDTRAFKRFERMTDLVGGVNTRRGEPGAMWARLHRGTYWMVDTSADRFLARKILTVQVSGARLTGVLPGRVTLRAINEVDWAKRPAAIPRSGRVVLRNNSEDNHFFGIARLKDGKTMADFERWVEQAMAGNETAGPLNWDVGVDSGVVGPGDAMSLRYSLPPGRYVMVCWWPDVDMDFMPHVFMGMYRGLRVR